jgi:hypothetical protein
MFRPFRTFLPALLAVVSFSFTACVGTVYDRMYSNRKNYFKAPAENKKEASAESILGAVDATKGGAAPGEGAAPGLPAPGGDIPGLPAPEAPADPAAAPMAPPVVPPPAN